MNLERAERLIVDGELLSVKQFEKYQEQWLASEGSTADGDGFVRWLVDERVLTDFQGRALLAGISGPYMLGPYRVSARVTAGRLGDVYRAEHVEFQQPVSLKVFPATIGRDPERLARLGREARVSLQVEDHPHVVKTYQVGRVGDVPFLALEELRGETLEQKLAREGRLPFGEACQIIQQAALGLAYLHSQDIIHRNICPANLWVTSDGVVKILDFGAALDAMSFIDSVGDGDEGGELTMNLDEDSVLGHYDYMSAEQAEDPHAADVASDLYSLGCTLYRCLTGQVPFPDKNPVRQMLRHANETPRPVTDFVPDIPQAVQELVSYLLAKRPDERYGSAEETAAALAYIMPLATMPEPITVAPDFLQWVQTVDADSVGVLKEVTAEPELQQFVDWLWHEDDQLAP
jgi:eukaryotic-like serine/threonine-protein kinase